MKVLSHFFLLLIFFSFSMSAWCVPLDELHQNEELFEPADSNILPDNMSEKDENSFSLQNSKKSGDALFNRHLIKEPSSTAENGVANTLNDKQIIVSDEQNYYLFEQEELDKQKPGLEIYQALAPMLSPELKKDAKKIWAETVDFRDAIHFSADKSESKELILQSSSKEMTLLKGKTLDEISNKNMPPAAYDKKDPDKAMVRQLFDDFYELIKNALLIIAGVLLSGKIISLIVKKIITVRERRKKRHARRHSRRRRKKRRRTFA